MGPDDMGQAWCAGAILDLLRAWRPHCRKLHSDGPFRFPDDHFHLLVVLVWDADAIDRHQERAWHDGVLVCGRIWKASLDDDAARQCILVKR